MAALVLAPTPLAAARAARRLCDAQGGILFGPQVSTIDRLVPSLLAAAGDRRAVLGPLGERLVAAAAGREAGGPFEEVDAASGLAAALAAAIGELRAAEVTPGDARAAAAELSGASASRLGALAAALAAYEARLARLGALDAAGAARAAADALRRGARPAEIEELDLLVVAGIAEVTPAGWDLLASLAARARRARFQLPYFPERPDLSLPAEPLLRRVESLHALPRTDVEAALGRIEGEGRAPLPAAVLAAFGGGRAPAGREGGLVLAVPGDGEDGEAEAAAAAAARLLEAGLAPDELAVVAPSPRRTAARLARAFAALGIPFAAGRGPPLRDVPAARAVLDALAAADGRSRGAVERAAASTYLGVGGAPLASLLDRAGAMDGRVGPAAALARRAAALAAPGGARERGALQRAGRELEALLRALAPLASPGTGREHAARLAAFVDAAGIRRRAVRAPADVAARDLAALRALEEAAEALSRDLALAGDGSERLDAARFRALLELAVDAAALPAAGEPAAGAIELSSLDEAPALAVRGAVLTGCARGAWPPAPAPEPLLRDAERIALARAAGRVILPTASARRARAVHRAFAAAAAGREALAFVFGSAGAGARRGAALAPLAADALAAAGVEVPAAPAADPPLASARTARAALRAAARAGRDALPALAGTALASRAAEALARGEADHTRRDAARGGAPSPHAGAIEGPALEVLRAALPVEWAPTSLEAFAECPFRLLVRLGLGLADPAAADLDPDARDEGSLLHAVLERIVAARVARGAWPPEGDEGDLAEARAAALEVLARFEAEGRTGDPAVWAARREVVLARVARAVRAEAGSDPGLVPALLEHAFGGAAEAPALELESGGERVRLRGRIDRVDAGPGRLLVIDYKSGRDAKRHAEKLAPDAFGRGSFQVPAYLLVAARDLPGRRTLAATYQLLGAAERLEPVELEADDPRLATSAAACSPGAAAPLPFAAAVVDAVRRIRAGRFPTRPGGCERCPHRSVCRLDAAAVPEDA